MPAKSVRRGTPADEAVAPRPQRTPATPLSSAGVEAVDRRPASDLRSAFGVDFGLPAGSTVVMVDGQGDVVEGHLQVFAAAGEVVATHPGRYDSETKHQAAAREFRRSQAVGGQSAKLLGHCARLGSEAGKSQSAVAEAAGTSRSLIARVGPAMALMDRYPELALSKSHFEAVLPLEDAEQERLLREAASKQLPVRELEDMIAATHPERHRRQPGRDALVQLVELAGLAPRLGPQWQENRPACLVAVRRLLRLARQRAPQLLAAPRGTGDGS